MAKRVLALSVIVGSVVVPIVSGPPVRDSASFPPRAGGPDTHKIDLTRWAGLAYAKADADRWYAEAVSHPAVVPLRHKYARREGNTGASIEACILARENGGDYGRSTNPNHFGAYQFDRQTWAANGGDPNTWGSASPEEQDRVFRNTVDAHGYSAWTPYDGCAA